MTAKIKALELYTKFILVTPIDNEHYYTKKCALIVVDEIISDRERLSDSLFYDLNYWQQVKKEIEKL